MATANSGGASQPNLVNNTKSKSAVWKHFGYKADESGKATDHDRPVCKECYKEIATKSSSTTNLAKHLRDRHPKLHDEMKQAQADAEKQLTSTNKPFQPTLPALFDQQRKYGPKSPETLKLNRLVAEYICMDQVPIYSVEKPGFQQLVTHLNPRYSIPSRNFFMYSEIPALYKSIKDVILNQFVGKPFYSCTTDLWTSRASESFMAVTIQSITDSWEMTSWCLGCVGIHSDHTGENIREAFEEVIQDTWKLDLNLMAGLTTDNASNNKKAFEQDFLWIPCFGHNLDLAVSKSLEVDKVSSTLSRLRKTVSAFSRSPKMVRLLKNKQKELQLVEHSLIHDEPTRWGSSFEMVDRFLEQQQAVCAVLAENRKKWHLMPKDTDITTLETVQEVLGPLSSFTDALSGETHTTLSSVLPLCWKIFSVLTVEDDDSHLKRQMKELIAKDLKTRYQDGRLQLLLNIATFLDSRFKLNFTTLKDEVKEHLCDSLRSISNIQNVASPCETRPAKKSKTDLKGLLSDIQGEKKKHPDAPHEVEITSADRDRPEYKLKNELTLYQTMPEVQAEHDPLTWWKANHTTFPHLALLAKKYLCIAASSCASERIFSTSGLICSPRRARLTEEHIDIIHSLTCLGLSPPTRRIFKKVFCNEEESGDERIELDVNVGSLHSST
nr:E3 SUMO-protein ligase ZBED1-like [Nothobranchius furzeri]